MGSFLITSQVLLPFGKDSLRPSSVKSPPISIRKKLVKVLSIDYEIPQECYFDLQITSQKRTI